MHTPYRVWPSCIQAYHHNVMLAPTVLYLHPSALSRENLLSFQRQCCEHNDMPADRRKKPETPEEVPNAGDPDRKRVLNVLAQRRYRMLTFL
jgi:hypothetical protein